MRILTKTIIKSNMVQKLVKYFVNPNATHFNNISTTNIKQKAKLVQYNIRFKSKFFSAMEKWKRLQNY